MVKRFHLFPVYFVYFIDNMAFSVLFGLLTPLLLNPEYNMVDASIPIGIKNFIIGAIFATFPLTQLLGAPIIGDLADRFGRKRTFKLTILGTAVGFLLSGLSVLLHSISLLILSRFLSGFFAGNQSLTQATIADLSPKASNRGKHFGVISALGGVAWVFGIFVGGFFSNPKNSKYFSGALPFWIVSSFILLSYFAIVFFFKETYAKETKFKIDLAKGIKNIRDLIKEEKALIYYLIYFLFCFGWIITIQYVSPLALEVYKVSTNTVTLFYVALGIGWTLGGSVLNRLALNHFDSQRTLLISLIITTSLLFLNVFSKDFIVFGSIYVIASLFGAMSWSNALNLISINHDAEKQGKAMGIGQSYMSLAGISSPLLGGLVSIYTIKAIFPISVFILAINVLIVLFVGRKKIPPPKIE